MKYNNRFFCLLGISLLLGSKIALGGSTFQYLLEPATQAVSLGGSATATLVLRETFDGAGSELLDSTDGPGLFSFSVSISQGSSTSGIPATISSISLDAAFEPLVSDVTLNGPAGAFTGADLSGAVGLFVPPLTDGPATGVAGTLDVQLATLNLNASSVAGDTTDFVSALHPMANFFPVLDGIGTPINVTYGGIGQLSTVPEPATLPLLLVSAGVAIGLVRRRRKA